MSAKNQKVKECCFAFSEAVLKEYRSLEKQTTVAQGVIATIQARIDKLKSIRENYLSYIHDRLGEADLHGTWDAAVNISEVEHEIAGLEYAVRVIDAGNAEEARGRTVVDPRSDAPDPWLSR